MDVGDHFSSVCDIALDLGNDGAGHDVMTDVGNGSMSASRQGRRGFSGCTGCRYQIPGPFLVRVADLA